MSVRSYGVLSTYPPTQCGLATFTDALVTSLMSKDNGYTPVDLVREPVREVSTVGVVAVVDTPEQTPLPEVAHQWVRSARGGAIAAAAALNRYDVAIVQHEYGIFGGRDGADVLETVRALRIPAIVVLHTVLATPTSRQRVILEELARICAAVVTMTKTAGQRLIDHYTVDPAKIRLIPHGAADNRAGQPEDRHQPISRSPVILTWGLLGAGKGIEWGIDAMAQLADLRPAAHYRVVGQTHPRVLEQHGESYRTGLVERARRRGVGNAVHFDARYLSSAELYRLIRQADVVLLPYDSREQVTSGVLIEAVAAGKPVVSTAFPHARELLSSGAGLLVERESPTAIATALRRVLTEPGLADRMGEEADRLAPELLWSSVSRKYRALATETLQADRKLATA
ncbi:glycosyltransferase [Nocardia sp. NPDC057440]|uniref:glycosyltransferase n=1 Tax=Nocardia sp. NPDC057440 TaxID=3346134 RepID=UPI00366BD2E3